MDREFTGFKSGLTFNRIITKTLIRDLLRDAEFIQIIRSGVYFVLGHLADVIEDVCRMSERPKEIRIILPSIFNDDVAIRAIEAGRNPAEVRAKLGDWQETFALLAQRLSPKHLLEVRTTMGPHRYHTIFTESEGILGVPWHTKASLTTSSFLVGPDASTVILNLHDDFDIFWNRCRVYQPGDNERMRKEKIVRRIDDPVLLGFGRSLPRVLDTVRYVVSAFPLSDGSGATKDHLHEKFGIDKSDSNRLLMDMEIAGLVRRLFDRQGQEQQKHGRIATSYGNSVVEKYRDFSF